MKTHLLQKEIIIPAPIETVWRFFADPKNLQNITPGYIKFKILKCPEVDEIYDGMLIEYKIRPVCNIPLTWITLIQSVTPQQRFTDKQVNGPYSLWEHTHTFQTIPEGTLMKDTIKYALPFGPLGTLAHRLFVRKQLQSIFEYREKIIPTFF